MVLKFRTKLLLINLVAIGTISLLLCWGVYSIITYQMHKETWGFLKDEFREYSLKYEAHLDDLSIIEYDMQQHFTKARMTYPIVCRFYDSFGQTLIQVENEPGTPVTPQENIHQALQGNVTQYETHSQVDGSPYWFALRKMVAPNQDVYAFELGMNVKRLMQRTGQLRTNMLILVSVVLVISFAAAWLTTNHALTPLSNINTTLQHIRSTSLDQRLPVRNTNDEIDILAKTVNQMLDEIQESFMKVQDFTADAAHELRTPVTKLMVMLEHELQSSTNAFIDRNLLDDAFEQCCRLNKLMDDLMLLTRLDTEEFHEEWSACDLGEFIHDLLELWTTACEEKGIKLYVKSPRHQLIEGRPLLLRRLFSNLMDNAIRYTPNGKTIHLDLTHTSESYIITITNSGVAIPTEEIPKLFQRFYRLDPARNPNSGGTGLGLSICQKICSLHKGSIQVKSHHNEETQFTVKLPK